MWSRFTTCRRGIARQVITLRCVNRRYECERHFHNLLRDSARVVTKAFNCFPREDVRAVDNVPVDSLAIIKTVQSELEWWRRNLVRIRLKMQLVWGPQRDPTARGALTS